MLTLIELVAAVFLTLIGFGEKVFYTNLHNIHYAIMWLFIYIATVPVIFCIWNVCKSFAYDDDEASYSASYALLCVAILIFSSALEYLKIFVLEQNSIALSIIVYFLMSLGGFKTLYYLTSNRNETIEKLESIL